MSKDIYFISDTHFNHANILNFKRNDDSPLRQFDNVSHMNEVMIDNWNKVVKPQDKIYHLGDVAFGNVSDFQSIMKRLNGHKRLIAGNHDKFDTIDYLRAKDDGLKLFEMVIPCREFGDQTIPFIVSHIPIHRDSLQKRRGFFYNVHGHTHEQLVKTSGGIPDSGYINICVEHTNYSPIHLEDLMKRMK
jgi:calcineurin-like phosphoesterase family protein